MNDMNNMNLKAAATDKRKTNNYIGTRQRSMMSKHRTRNTMNTGRGMHRGHRNTMAKRNIRSNMHDMEARKKRNNNKHRNNKNMCNVLNKMNHSKERKNMKKTNM